MAKKKHAHRPKRGYPVAILVGFEPRRGIFWQVFSETVKPFTTVKFVGKRGDEKAVYAFHESIVNALRPAIQEGIRSVLLIGPVKTSYTADFLDHVQKHHLWLVKPKSPNAVTFGILEGAGSTFEDVLLLTQSDEFKTKVSETTGEESDQIIAALEKYLQQPNSDRDEVLYSLPDIENVIYTREAADVHDLEYIILTDQYLATSPEKNRLQRLLQVAKNKSVKTRVIQAESPAGERLAQFGGIIWFIFSRKD